MKSSFHRTAESTAWLTSVAVHLAITVALGFTTIMLPRQLEDLQLALQTITLPDEEISAEEFVAADLTPQEIGAVSQHGDESALASAMEADDTSLVLFETEPVSDFGERLTVDVSAPVFRGPELSERLDSGR